jgi:hypothetical protein
MKPGGRWAYSARSLALRSSLVQPVAHFRYDLPAHFRTLAWHIPTVQMWRTSLIRRQAQARSPTAGRAHLRLLGRGASSRQSVAN